MVNICVQEFRTLKAEAAQSQLWPVRALKAGPGLSWQLQKTKYSK